MAREITLRDALNEAMSEEMRRDPDVFLIGEEVEAIGYVFAYLLGSVAYCPTSSPIKKTSGSLLISSDILPFNASLNVISLAIIFSFDRKNNN